MTPIELTHKQSIVFKEKKRFRVLVAGRRFGKTFLSKVASLEVLTSGENKLVWYIAPTLKLAKEIFWSQIKDLLIESGYIAKNGIRESELSITLTNGSKIALKGTEDPDS